VRRLTEIQFLLSHFLHPARLQSRQDGYGPHPLPQPYSPPDYLALEKEPYVNDARMKVIFLCTGNSARSQMAEAFLRKYAGDRFEVHSAGIEPKGLNPYTRRVMEEAGIDMSGHRSKGVREYLGHVNFGYVITVCDDAEQNCPTAFLGQGTHLHWSFEDPARAQGSEEEILARFRAVRDQIDHKIDAWVGQLRSPAKK
jgi:arsenate reductase